MKAGWGRQKLGDFSEIKYGFTAKARPEPVGPRFLRITDIQNNAVEWDRVPFCVIPEKDQDKHRLIKGDIVFARTGATTGKSYLIDTPPDAVCASYLIKVRQKTKNLDPKFLNYYFQTSDYWDTIALGTEGAAQGGFNATKLANLEIPIPPLDEQRRIVAVLDDAFEGLDRARKNTETSLTDMRELFDAQLENSFSIAEEKSSRLRDLIEITHGFAFKSNQFDIGLDLDRPIVLTPGNYTEEATISIEGPKVKRLIGDAPQKFQFARGDLTVVMTDLSSKMKILGKPAFVDTDNMLHNQRIGRIHFKNSDLKKRYLYYFLRTARARRKIIETATGTMVRHTAPKRILDLEIPMPRLVSDQSDISQKLDEVSAHCATAKGIYTDRISALKTLQQSLLQKAFAGELTTSKQHFIQNPANDDTSPEFSAYILAYAYNAHLAEERQKTLGHVKAQKTLHLAEALSHRDFGRKPIKDAAGPNDMEHMRRAEDWAKANKLFRFEQERGRKGYTFLKMSNYDAQLPHIEEELKPLWPVLDHINDVLVPMDTQEAEVFATVFAAWNNLILDRVEINDEAIVTAAREDWHESKMKIPRENFFKAIRQLRDADMVPDGSAKPVGIQANLL